MVICRSLTVGLAMLGLCAAAHYLLGLEQAMGLFALGQRPTHYFGPLVNANHLATCLLLLLPSAVYVWRVDTVRAWRIIGALSALVAGALMVAVQSVGAALVAAFVAAVAWARERERSLTGGVLLIGGVVLGAFFLFRQPTWLDNSLFARWDQYSGTLRMFAERPWFGWGAGTYEVAFAPFDRSGRFFTAEHAHSDVLEWVAETGIFGLLLVLTAAWLSVRARDASTAAGRVFGYGLLAATLHAWVEFPLHIPAVAMLYGLVWAAWVTSESEGPSLSVPTQRGMVFALAILQIPMGLWAFRDQMEVRATADLLAEPTPQSIQRLERWAPWSPQVGLAELVVAAKSGDLDRAVALGERLAQHHPRDADVQRRVGVFLSYLGRDEASRAHLEASVRARPSDFRSYLALGRLAARSGRGDEAVERYGDALKRAPIDPKLLEEAYALLPVGDHWVDVLSEAEPHMSVLLYRVVHREEPEAALRAIEQAVALRPAYYADHPLRAAALIPLGRLDEARAWLNPRLPDDRRGNLWAMLGTIEEKESHLDAAVAAYLEAEARGSVHARVNAVRAIGALRDPESALQQAREWVGSGEGSPRLIVELATLEYQQQNAQACLDALSMDALASYEAWADRVKSLRARCETLQREMNASPG